MIKRSILFLVWFFIPFLCSAQVAATIVKVDSLKPGDVFDYIIVVKKNRIFEKMAYPDSADFGEDFDIVSFKHFTPNPQTDSLVYKLQFFGVGDKQLPELPVHYINGKDTLSVFSDVVPVFYKTLVEEGNKDTFKPLKPIYEFASLYWMYILGVIILLVLFAYLLNKYVLNKPKEEEIPAEPAVFIDPFKELDTRLEEIKQSDELKKAEFKLFYTNLGDAIRLYIDRVYKEAALEMTTTEVKRALSRRKLDAQILNMILLVLSQADLIKFAKYTPSLESAYDDLERAFELAKKFRQTDKSRVAEQRYQFEIAHGLRKPEVEEKP